MAECRAPGRRRVDLAAGLAEKAGSSEKGFMHTLFLHNSLSRRKERFEPLEPQHVRMYLCGPTVYDLPHIGNARTMVVFDVLNRLLRELYPRVTYVRNITDVDDKINARAKESGEPIGAITARTTADFHADMVALGVLAPDEEPRATQNIAQMQEIIQKLIASGHAYAAEGHVLFSVRSFPAYGRLSGHSPDELLAGARIDVAPYKRDPGDFVLWKPSTPDLPGWDSPWGRGRPGWHIECSAMSWRYLGETFDIHGGGTDLIFPHHENELAQSVCAFPGSHFARYWVHSGMLNVDGVKMSKSLGNFFTSREVLEKEPAEAVRLLLIRTHYRSTPDFNDAAMAEAKREMDRFYRALEKYPAIAAVDAPPSVMAALCDDMNTPLALSAMHALSDRALAGDFDAACGLRAAGRVMGLLQADPGVWFRGGTDDVATIEAAITERLAARKARDFARADAIRAELAAKGILLEDGAQGTTWRRTQ
jgi:cysteinyl-tRNA synthetase